ncbi:MAG: hypothetical protein HC808_15105 [Candidatus Competibacteraceae bacterium]|nr:hypothetical protein [Candidatus Competibacteraceae bacterium]
MSLMISSVNQRLKWCWLVLVAFLLLTALTACSSGPDSPEDQVRALIEQATEAAERKAVDELHPLIADEYDDAQGHDKTFIKRLLLAYLMRNQSIHLFTRIKAVAMNGPDRAQAEVVVAMTGQPVEDAATFDWLRGELYHFVLDFIHRGGGDWELIQAQWRPANVGEFL